MLSKANVDALKKIRAVYQQQSVVLIEQMRLDLYAIATKTIPSENITTLAAVMNTKSKILDPTYYSVSVQVQETEKVLRTNDIEVVMNRLYALMTEKPKTSIYKYPSGTPINEEYRLAVLDYLSVLS